MQLDGIMRLFVLVMPGTTIRKEDHVCLLSLEFAALPPPLLANTGRGSAYYEYIRGLGMGEEFYSKDSKISGLIFFLIQDFFTN
jgi:hypothetical protein